MTPPSPRRRCSTRCGRRAPRATRPSRAARADSPAAADSPEPTHPPVRSLPSSSQGDALDAADAGAEDGQPQPLQEQPGAEPARPPCGALAVRLLARLAPLEPLNAAPSQEPEANAVFYASASPAGQPAAGGAAAGAAPFKQRLLECGRPASAGPPSGEDEMLAGVEVAGGACAARRPPAAAAGTPAARRVAAWRTPGAGRAAGAPACGHAVKRARVTAAELAQMQGTLGADAANAPRSLLGRAPSGNAGGDPAWALFNAGLNARRSSLSPGAAAATAAVPPTQALAAARSPAPAAARPPAPAAKAPCVRAPAPAAAWGDSDDDEFALAALGAVEAARARGGGGAAAAGAGAAAAGAAAGAGRAAPPQQQQRPAPPPAPLAEGAPPPPAPPALPAAGLAAARAAARHEVVAVEGRPGGAAGLCLRLRNAASGAPLLAALAAPWDDGDFRPGDWVNLVLPPGAAPPAVDAATGLPAVRLAADHGILVHFPDVLLSPTRVTPATECVRRAYLDETRSEASEAGPGFGFASKRGEIHHELFQRAAAAPALPQREEMAALAADIVARHAPGLELAGDTAAGALAYLLDAVGDVGFWLQRYAFAAAPGAAAAPLWACAASQAAGARERDPTARAARVAIGEVVDIEEYIASPLYGLKGKVDLTARLAVAPGAGGAPPGAWAPAPLELKTGTVRRGDAQQVLLYMLMLEERYGQRVEAGLLWYSDEWRRDTVKWRRAEEDRGARLIERRDGADLAHVMAARNRLAAALVRRELPPPSVAAVGACRNCFLKARCPLAAAAEAGGADGGAAGPDGGAAAFAGGDALLRARYEAATRHLTPADRAFLREWDELLALEAGAGGAERPPIWATSGAEAEAAGHASLAALELTAEAAPAREGGGWRYTLTRAGGGPLPACAFAENDYLSLSIEGRQAVVAHCNLVALRPDAAVVRVRTRLRRGLRRPAPGAPGFDHVAPGGAPAPALGDLAPSQGAAAGAAAPAAPGLRWRLDKLPTLTSRSMRGELASLFRAPAPPGVDDAGFGAQAARLRRLIVALEAPAAPPAEAAAAAAAAAKAAAPELNDEQAEAVGRAVAGADYTLVLGMPGAGKSTAVVAAVVALVEAGKSVLLTGYTSCSVDTLLLKLMEANAKRVAAGAPPVPFARAGDPSRCDRRLAAYAAGGAAHGGAGAAALSAVPVVGATALSAASDALLLGRRFDVCVVDEAGQITLPATLAPLLRARAFVLVGDPHQLPPLVASEEATARGLAVPLFHRLAAAHPAAVAELRAQFRMAEEVQALPNLLTYAGRLRCGSAEVAGRALALAPGALAAVAATAGVPAWLAAAVDPARRVVFLDTSALGPGAHGAAAGASVTNAGEATLVAAALAAAAAAGAPRGALGALSPFSAQVGALARRAAAAGLPPWAADFLTVDKSQGRDWGGVLLSFAASNAARQPGRALCDARRLNVALTRAKGKLIMVGDAETLRAAPGGAALVEACAARGWAAALPAGALGEAEAALAALAPLLAARSARRAAPPPL